MLELTVEMIAAGTGARIDRAQEAMDGLVEAMRLYAIDTSTRAAFFLANVGHETLGLKYLQEIWGPTPQQLRYERDFSQAWPSCDLDAHRPSCERNRLAWRLGNVNQGDGSLFRGHGMLQDTGRFNHARRRDRLRKRFPELAVPDFEADPAQLATARWAAIAAADYVDEHGCNAYADASDFDAYCDAINLGRHTLAIGDSNGYADRARLLAAVDGGGCSHDFPSQPDPGPVPRARRDPDHRGDRRGHLGLDRVRQAPGARGRTHRRPRRSPGQVERAAARPARRGRRRSPGQRQGNATPSRSAKGSPGCTRPGTRPGAAGCCFCRHCC